MNELQKRTWAEVKLDNIEHNYRTLIARYPEGTKFLGVVKADAYGHGAVKVAQRLEQCGADYLAVACLDEALVLRENGIKMPILILGHTPPEYTQTLVDNGITQAVSCLAKAKDFSLRAAELGKTLKVHIKVDTGMSRMGFLVAGEYFDGGVQNIIEACKLPNLETEGIFTHFAVSDYDDSDSVAYTKKQYNLFMSVIESAEKLGGIKFAIRHCANSGAVVNHPYIQLDMIRPGYLLYGYGDGGKLGLKPAMSLISTIGTIKFYEPDTCVSYGRHFTTDKRTRMGVVCAGYADGLPWAAANKGCFYIDKKPVPQRGNICMDMCMVELNDRPDVKVGSRVEIFGENAPLEELAKNAGTIGYEILCAVTKRVPRVYL